MATTGESFSRLSNSPTLRRFQLRLAPIKTCRLPSPPHSPRFDVAAEENAAGGGSYEDMFGLPPLRLVAAFEAAVQELVQEKDNKMRQRRLSPEKVAAAAQIVGFDVNGNRPQPTSLDPARTISSFDRKLHDLPIPIRWWLAEACREAMQELVADVEKEIMNSSGAAFLVEDLRVWEDVMAAAEAVGMEVTEITQKLIDKIRPPHFESAFQRSKNQAALPPECGDGSFESRFRDLALPIPWRLVTACRSIMLELVAEVEEVIKNAGDGEALPEDVSAWNDVVTAAEMVGLDVDEIKSRAAALQLPPAAFLPPPPAAFLCEVFDVLSYRNY